MGNERRTDQSQSLRSRRITCASHPPLPSPAPSPVASTATHPWAVRAVTLGDRRGAPLAARLEDEQHEAVDGAQDYEAHQEDGDVEREVAQLVDWQDHIVDALVPAPKSEMGRAPLPPATTLQFYLSTGSNRFCGRPATFLSGPTRSPSMVRSPRRADQGIFWSESS